MEYLRGWRALTADPEWKRKFGIASLLIFSTMFIPLAGQLVVVGWLTLAVRRAVQGQDSPLPELNFNFDYLSKLVGVGFKPVIARFVYSLPLVVFIIVFEIVMGIMGAVVAVAAGPHGHGEGGSAMGIVLGIVMLVGYLLLMAAVFVVTLYAHVAAMRAEIMNDLKAAMNFGAVRRMTRLLLKELIIGHIVLGFIGMALITVGLLACWVGIFPAATVLSVIMAYFNAELYKAYLAKGGEPLPVGPVDVAQPAAAAPAPVAF